MLEQLAAFIIGAICVVIAVGVCWWYCVGIVDDDPIDEALEVEPFEI